MGEAVGGQGCGVGGVVCTRRAAGVGGAMRVGGAACTGGRGVGGAAGVGGTRPTLQKPSGVSGAVCPLTPGSAKEQQPRESARPSRDTSAAGPLKPLPPCKWRVGSECSLLSLEDIAAPASWLVCTVGLSQSVSWAGTCDTSCRSTSSQLARSSVHAHPGAEVLKDLRPTKGCRAPPGGGVVGHRACTPGLWPERPTPASSLFSPPRRHLQLSPHPV